MHDILLKVQDYLERAGKGEAEMPLSLIEEFGELCKTALKKRFEKLDKPRPFTIRMSNVGRPLCQLIGERDGVPAEPMPYQDVMKFFLGDLIESAAIVVMKGAGVDIEAQHQGVSLDLNNGRIDGTYDIKIRGDGIYDIKSASPYSFRTKFNNKFNNHAVYQSATGEHDDTFGYLAQGIGYGLADKSPFRGWIAIDKSTGEWAVTELLPEDFEKHKETSLAEINSKYDAVKDDNRAFAPEFEPEPEIYYKKVTGNMCLGYVCSMCPRKWSCWPTVRAIPSLPSTGDNKKIKFYTEVDEKWRDAIGN